LKVFLLKNNIFIETFPTKQYVYGPTNSRYRLSLDCDKFTIVGYYKDCLLACMHYVMIKL